MEVVSASSLPVGSLLWRPRPDAWMLTFACKATFDLLPGEARLSAQQEPINDEDRHYGADTARSLYAASDLVPFKPGADVVLVGSAHAPGGKPTRSLFVRLIVGDVDKGLEVAADSIFLQDGTLQEGAAFSRMALLYERAAGGPDTWNPVGVRADVHDVYGRTKVPNLRPPGLHVSSPADVIPPVGFGPLAAHWPSRRDKLGRHAPGWTARAVTERPLPEDLDRAFFQAAPFDQRLAVLREDQRLILENLLPEVPRLATNLPGLRPRARVEGPSGTRILGLKCDTLWIDTDRGICTLTWSSQLPLESPSAKGRVIIDVQDLVPEVALKRPAADLRQTMPFIGDEDARAAASAALPFVQPLSAPALPDPSELPTLPPPPPAAPLTAVALPPPAPIPSVELRPAPAPIPSVELRPAPVPMPASPWAAAAAGIEQAAARSIGEAAVTAATAEGSLPAIPTADVATVPAAARPSAPAEPREAFHLIWYDAPSVARICAVPVFRATMDDLTREILEGFEDLDDGSPAKDPAELEDRRDVFSILARAATMDVSEIGEELLAAVRPDRKFVPPLLLLAGEISFPFDEREALNATVGVVTPLVGGDEVLRTAIDDAKELLDASHLICPPEVVEGMTARIKEVFQKVPRKVTLDYVEAQIEHALLDRRAYQRRQVLGMTAIRALLHTAQRWGTATPAPVYLPETMARRLPGYPRFRVRLIAELHLRTDQFEPHAGALKALSICRVSTMTTPRGERRPGLTA